MTTDPRRALRQAVLSAALALGACADEDRLLVALKSNMALAFLQAQVVDAETGELMDEGWLDVTGSCPVGSDGVTDLGSFELKRLGQRDATLLVRGYSAESGAAVQQVEQRVDIVFQHGTLAFELLLFDVCRGVSCPAALTCDPTSGGCRDVARIETQGVSLGRGPYCLARRDAAPPVRPSVPPPSAPNGASLGPDDAATGGVKPTPVEPHMDAGASFPDCTSNDGKCPDGCFGRRDTDCLVALGRACGPTTDECASPHLCRDEYCCDQPCDDPCMRCDLPGREGRCTHVVYADVEAPRSDPAFSAACGQDHISVSCTASKCEHACEPGYDSCDRDLQSNGCERRLGTPTDCKKCDDACVYEYCDTERRQCVANPTTDLNVDGAWPAQPNTLYATRFVPTTADTVVRALGVLVNPVFPSRSLRIAMYESDGFGPSTLLVGTDALPVVDNPRSAIERKGDELRVEAAIAPTTIDFEKDYFIAIQVADKTQLHGAAEYKVNWLTAAAPYGAFPELYPLNPQLQEFVVWSLYAVTTPR